MTIKKPSLTDIIQFITNTHTVEGVDTVTLQTVTNTAQRKEKNVYAHGHLSALSYAVHTLLPSQDYPARNVDFKDIPQMESNIHWLKHLNSLTQSPLIADPNQQYTLSKIGIWRIDNASNTFTNAPSPFLIPYIMFNWLKRLTKIHNNVKAKLDNPYGLSEQEFVEMRTFAEQQPCFFSTVQPFKYDNNRFGRLIENVILLGWNIPLKTAPSKTYEQFKESLEEYQRIQLQTIIKEAQQLKTVL
jgi:hypothetical protein